MGNPKRHVRTKVSILLITTIWLLVIGLIGCDQAPADIHTGTPVKVLVVMLELTKQPNCPTPADCAPYFDANGIAALKTPRHTASEYLAMLDQKVNTYYHNATYGQVYFDFELLPGSTRADGWWDSPYSMEEINKSSIDFKQIAMEVAYSALGANLANYERVIIISNFQSRGGQTCCLHAPTPFYALPGYWKVGSGSLPMIVAMINEGSSDQELVTVTSHELGHTLGAPDQYYGNAVGMGPWDLMDDDWNFFHFGAWTKLDRGWIDWVTNTTALPCVMGSCEITTVLNPEEIQGNNALLIPISHIDEFEGFLVECRKPINGDQGIPEEGVLISLSNPYNKPSLAQTISEVQTNESNPYSLLQPGEVYYNKKYDVRVINLSNPGDSTCTVKAQRAIAATTDVYITQGAVTQGDPYDKYKSPDIWNDNQLNGGYNYPGYETITLVDTENHGEIGQPSGYGDPILIWETGESEFSNYFNFLVHNGGTSVAKDVKVNVYMRQPLSATIQPDSCATSTSNIPVLAIPKLIGSVVIPSLEPGHTYHDSVPVHMLSDAPLEIEVEIEPVDGEVDIQNNIAYETYWNFYGEGISLSDALNVGLSSSCLHAVPFQAMEIPDADGSRCKNWQLTIEPSSGFMLPGETVNFNISGKANAGVAAGDTCDSQFGVFMPLTDVYTPVESFGFEGRQVDSSLLSCATPEGSSALGTTVSVTGELTPGKADTISLVYTDPTGKPELKNLVTAASGQYSDQYLPSLTGTWHVQAFWVGDDKHAPTQSSVCPFVVEEVIVREPPMFRPGQAVQCRRGPSSLWDSLGFTQAGVAYAVKGTNPENTWVNIQYTNALRCWVKADTGEASGDLSGVPVLVVQTITPTLVPTITPTPVPQVNCGAYTSADQCNMVSACYWEDASPTHPTAECKPR